MNSVPGWNDPERSASLDDSEVPHNESWIARQGRRVPAGLVVTMHVVAFILLCGSLYLAARADQARTVAVGITNFAARLKTLETRPTAEQVTEILSGGGGFQLYEADFRNFRPRLSAETGQAWGDLQRDALVPLVEPAKLQKTRRLAEQASIEARDAAFATTATAATLLTGCLITSVIGAFLAWLGLQARGARIVVQQVNTVGTVASAVIATGALEPEAKGDVNDIPVPAVRINNGGTIEKWNDPMAELSGLTAAQTVGRAFADVIGWGPLGEVAKSTLYRVFSGEPARGVEWSFQHALGQELELRASLQPLRGSGGDVTGALVIVEDITGIKEQAQLLINSDITKTAMLSALPDTLLRFDMTGSLVEIRDNANLMGNHHQMMLGSGWHQIFPEAFVSRIKAVIRDVLTNRRPTVFTSKWVRGGDEQYAEIRVVPCGHTDVLAVLHDVTERHRAAVTDSLTGARNHQAMMEFLSAAADYVSQGGRVTVALVDIDRFTEFNSRYGHEAGDDILRRLARHLEARADKNDVIARYAGEEFAWIMPEVSVEEAAVTVRATLSEFTTLNPHVTLTWGIAQRHNQATQAADFLTDATADLDERTRTEGLVGEQAA